MDAKQAHQISERINEKYENAITTTNIEQLKLFLIKHIEYLANAGCDSLQFETTNDFQNTDLINYFENLGYKVEFYKLKYSLSNAEYCLKISW